MARLCYESLLSSHWLFLQSEHATVLFNVPDSKEPRVNSSVATALADAMSALGSMAGAIMAETKSSGLESAKPDVFFFPPIELFSSAEKHALPRAVSIDQSNGKLVAIACTKGIREIDIESSVLYRARTQDTLQLVEKDYDNWSACLHRFDALQQPISSHRQPWIRCMYSMPLTRLRALLGADRVVSEFAIVFTLVCVMVM